jgi:hypothetical protein
VTGSTAQVSMAEQSQDVGVQGSIMQCITGSTVQVSIPEMVSTCSRYIEICWTLLPVDRRPLEGQVHSQQQ